MIYVGIDDTDVVGSRGTNQLARSLTAVLANQFRCERIVRHQLLDDPRVPCTTKNGSASMTLEALGFSSLDELVDVARRHIRSWFVEGSDPGLCVAATVPQAVIEFGWRAKRALVTQDEALDVARRHSLWLEALGGSGDGVIGALAAVGLAASNDDGRVVQLAQGPEHLSGIQSIDLLGTRGVTVRRRPTGQQVCDGHVDVGKRLRPNRHRGENVLYVESRDARDPNMLIAVKLP